MAISDEVPNGIQDVGMVRNPDQIEVNCTVISDVPNHNPSISVGEVLVNPFTSVP